MKPFICRDLHTNHGLLKLPAATLPAITWKVYLPGKQTVFMIGTFRAACIIAARYGKSAVA